MTTFKTLQSLALLAALLSFSMTASADPSDLAIFPEQEVNFVVRDNPGTEKILLIKKEKSLVIDRGIPRFVPARLSQIKDSVPNVRISSLPSDHPYQLLVLDRTPLVIDQSGRVFSLMNQPEGAGLPEVAAIKNGIVIGYAMKNGLYQIHLIHDTVYSYTAPHVKRLDQFLEGLDLAKKTFLGVNGRQSLLQFAVPKTTVSAMTSDGSSFIRFPFQNWKDYGDQIITNKATGVSVGASSTTAPAKGTAPATNSGVGGLARLRQAKQEQNDFLTFLKTDIVGQDFALERIAAQMAESQKNKTGKPKVLIAMGPSGAGKTFTAGKVAQKFHNNAVFEISGNEYRAHAGALDYMRLLGSASKADKGEGALIEYARTHQKGFTFVINEGEKMHPDIWLMLMEFFDTGVISDKDGKKIKVENLLVMITSNRGANRMFPATSVNWTQAEVDARLRSFTQKDLSNFFQQKDGSKDSFELPPEIMKRVDELIPFGIVTKEAALSMAKSAAIRVSASYKQEYSVSMTFDEAAIQKIAFAAWENGQDARTILRAVSGEMSRILDLSLDGLQLQEGNEILVKLKSNAKGESVLHATANGHAIDVALSNRGTENPLHNPEVVSRLKTLEATMNKLVIGQQQTISDVAVGVVSHTGRGGVTKPFTAYLLGVSGNGKTETGRALAKAAYNDEKRVAILPMGEISTSHDFDEKFGVSATMSGGDTEREFEKILREFPEGAVIVLDEISNMGGGEMSRKTALFQKLYNLIEEGKYISPRDGREFKLNKYKFILTGNDGEELFRGITGDDMLMETWRRNSSPESVRELMRKAGIPNAFVNRMDVVSLTKPLLSHEVAYVTHALWNKQLKEFKALYRGIEIEPEAGMLEQLAKTFFTADQGGRGVRKILENKIGGILLNALMNSDADLANLNGTKLKVGLRDTATSKAYLPTRNERAVVFRVQVERAGHSTHTELLDVTKVSPRQILLNKTNARLTAYHEAGHAVANLVELTGQRLAFLTIRGGSTGTVDYYGYARYEQVAGREGSNLTREQVIATFARLYAGRIAQEMAGFPPDAGWAEDLKQMRSLGTQYLLKFGLDPDFLALRVDKDGNPVMNGVVEQRFESRMNQMMEEGRALATQTLRLSWPLVRAVTADLLLRGQMTSQRFEEIRQKLASKTGRTNLKTFDNLRARTCRAAF